jgi:hypothetical protein
MSTKELTAARARDYLKTGNRKLLRPVGAKHKPVYEARRLPGEIRIDMPEPSAAEREKRKKIIAEIYELTKDKAYRRTRVIARLPPTHVGSRWYATKNRRGQG